MKLPDECGPTIWDHTKQHCRNKTSMITPEAWTPVIINIYIIYIYTYVFFWTYIQSLEFNQEKKGNIWQIELDGIRVTNFETVQLTF